MVLEDDAQKAKVLKQASHGVCYRNPPPLSLSKAQIEFYFSDSNLPKDKFLKEKIAADAEKCENLPHAVPKDCLLTTDSCFQMSISTSFVHSLA